MKANRVSPKFVAVGIAWLACAFAWGCSGDQQAAVDKAQEAASGAAETAKDAASELGREAGDAVGQAADQAGGAAGEMLDALRGRWNGQLEGFDGRFSKLKESAAKANDAELTSYVQAIETKLREAKEAFAGIAAGTADRAQIEETMSSKLTELGGLLQAAEDKLKVLTPGGE